MGRGKLKMELIKNEKARMVTYNKRRKGLVKKVEEFHILCNVDACLIILGPKLDNRPMEVETWPYDGSQVRRIINRYRSHSGERKRVQDLSHYFEGRKKKLADEIAKIHKASIKSMFPTWDPRLDLFQLHQLRAFDSTLQSKLEFAMARVFHFKAEIDNNIINSNPISADFSCLNMFDDHQMFGFNVNPLNSPMLMMNYSKKEARSAGGNLDQGNQNQIVVDQMVINNSRVHPVSSCDVSRQDPLMMMMMMPNNIRIPQISNFSAANEFQIGDSRH